MFRYGSFKLFFTKVLFGLGFCLFSIVLIVSLFTYDADDPGFKTFVSNPSTMEFSNYFGITGAYIASYSLVFIGHLSYLIGIFFMAEGVKFIFGLKNGSFVLKFFSNFLGVIFLSIVLLFYNFLNLELGIISLFLLNLFINTYSKFTSNFIIINFIYCFLFIVSFALLTYSFSLKISRFNRLGFLIKIFYFLKFLKYLNFFGIFKFVFKKRKKSIITKNEPTIRKRVFSRNVINKQSVEKKYKQTEINQFEFTLPDKSLLIKSSNKDLSSKSSEKLNSQLSINLEKVLSEYGIEGKITGYRSGPIVTLFEFVPIAGIKSSKIISLSDDIARAMSSLSARISSQPGKSSLGIEIPNSKRENVLFGDLIEKEQFEEENNSIILALGKDISGECIFANLEQMPHLLIAGTTGSGKSVGINTMILSVLYKFKPHECKLILIDPKMLELSVYEDIPHLLTPVVTDPNKAVFALKWVVREMENRYKLMSSVNVKNISSYNEKVLKTLSLGKKLFKEVQTGVDSDTRKPIFEKKEIVLEKLPFIVVVIDEMADLMMVAGKEVESLVQRLAQMARASGIHLVTATQRPSVDVITGTIKANFPSRISYKVASKFDSRTILNEMGAEQLLGSGDMLFLENAGNIKRLHGGFVSENEVEKVVNYIKDQATFDYKKEINLQEEDFNKSVTDLVSNNNDALYNKAVDLVIKQQKVSTSYIQRYLQIGYNRAARIVEKMEEDGIISESSNSGKRHVLKKE